MRRNWTMTLTIVLGLIGVMSTAKGAAVERIMDFHAVNRQTKEPLAGVTLTVRVSADNYKKRDSWDEKTDAEGFCRIKLPDYQIETLRLYPRKEGFVPLFIMWRGTPTTPDLPKVFTVKMEPSTTIGGVVQNERGEPIEGVAVGVHYQTHDPDAAENVYVDIMIHNALETDIRTDKEGRWTFDQMPAEIDKNELRIFLKHPNYLSDQLRPGFIPMPITRQSSIESLRDFSAVMVMKEGLEVIGKVTDKRGNPVAGVKIYDVDNYWFRGTKPFAETDAQGQFRVNANPGTVTWTVQAPGYTPDLKNIPIKDGISPIEIRLEPGHVIEGKVTDLAGKPVEGASIRAEDWRGNHRRPHLETKTDTEGRFKVVDTPADEVTFDIGKQGCMLHENYPMKPGQRKYDITLRPTLKVHGTVIDAKTGRPIDKFNVTSGFDHEDGRVPQWDTLSVRTFTGGQYEFEYIQEIFTYRLRIDAEGYQSVISDCIRPREISESQMVLDFKLSKAAAIVGKVFSSDGIPLPGAEVVIATVRLRIVNGKPEPRRDRSSEENLILHTGANGEFHFEPPASLYTILVLSKQGYAKVSQSDFVASKVITVSPWGRIEGILRIGAQPGIDKLVAFLPEFRRGQEQPDIEFEYEARTDENGHFNFPRILPDKGVVVRITSLDNGARRSSYHLRVEVKSAETTHVKIGGTGRPVVGKIIIPDMIKNIFDWQRADCSLRVSSPIDPPYIILPLECDKDGSFRVEDVPSGEYCLYVHAYESPPNTRTFRGERIGELSWPFSISEMPGGRSDEPLDLGELKLEVIGKSAFIPSLIGKPLPDFVGLGISLPSGEIESQRVLVCFWDMNQRPSRNCLLQLGKRAQELKAKDVVLVAVQASKVDKNTLNEWVKKNNVSFPVGMVEGNEEKVCFAWGVKSLPWLILTNAKHVVRAEGFGPDELEGKIRENENVQE